MSPLVQLYPRLWRDRYEAEFEALLAERPPRLRERFDILVGAIDARLDPQLQAPRPTRGPRRPIDWMTGGLAMTGGTFVTIWASGVAAVARPWGSGTLGARDLESLIWLSAWLGMIGLAGAVLAMLVRDNAQLGNAGSMGCALALVGILLTPAGLGGVLLLTLGIVLVAATGGGRTMPRLVAGLLVASLLTFLAGMLAFMATGGQDTGLLVLLLGLGPSWIVLGLDALRGPYLPPRRLAPMVPDPPGS